MNSWNNAEFFRYIFILIFTFLWQALTAQYLANDFRHDKYSLAINNIVEHADGKLNKEKVVQLLINSEEGHTNTKVNKVVLSEFFFLSPVISLVAFNGNENASFEYFASGPLNASTLLLDFSNSQDWVDSASASIDFTLKSITIGVFPNLTHLARSTSFEATAIIEDTLISFTGYILQQPAPQQLIFVSPNYLAVPAAGDEAIVEITHFNIDDNWEAVFTADWIEIEPVVRSVSSVIITIYPNELVESRHEIVEIRAVENHEINDFISVYQYGNTAPFLVASPKSNYISPEGGSFDVQVFSNITWDVEEIENPDNMISGLIPLPDEEILTIEINPNLTVNPRFGVLVVSGGNPLLTDTILVYQSAAYVILSPREKLLSCSSGSFGINVLRYGTGSIQITGSPEWANAITVSNDSIHITVSENAFEFARTGTVYVSSAENSLIYDSLILAQYSCSQSYIIVSPKDRTAAWFDTGLEKPFHIIFNNIGSPNVSVIPDDWLSTELFGDSLYVSLDTNYSNYARSAQVVVFDAFNPLVSDTVNVIQGGALAYILISPEFRFVPYTGGQAEPYTVLTMNVDEWEVFFEDSQPSWITNIHQTGSEVIFSLAVNNTFQTREATFQIRDVNDTTRFDEAIIFQKAAPEPFLFIAPRQKQVLHTGNLLLNFQVTAVNVGFWEPDAMSIPDWISVSVPDQSTLNLSVSENTQLETRMAMIRISDTSNPDVYDSVYIYQYSALDTLIMASPREKRITHNGGIALYDITTVNAENWEVETESLPDWLSVAAITEFQLLMDVMPNEALQSRQAMIRMFVSGQAHTYDSVYLYQYSALDSFLLASPREQLISGFGNTNVDFQVATANIASWEHDVSTVPEWITVNASGGDLLSLLVEGNETFQTRKATIRIFAVGQMHIEDSVTILQFSGPDAYLIAAPRERSVPHVGESMVDFLITMANIDGWEFIETAPYDDWIEFENIGDSILRLNIDENTLLETRLAGIIIQALNNQAVKDTVFIYQYSSLDQYLLAAPREHRVQYQDTLVHFDITVVNISDQWEVDILSGEDWIQVVASGEGLLGLMISENENYETRTGILRLYIEGENNASDTVLVYQFASPWPNILASPREQWVAHTGNNNLDFHITTANVDSWGVDLNGADWLSINAYGEEILSLSVSGNSLPETRVANIFLYNISNPEIKDSVFVYQYSALNSYLLVAPRERALSYHDIVTEFYITAVNISNWVIDPATLPDWVTFGNSSADTLRLDLALNTTLSTRIATITIFDVDNSEVMDSVRIFQYSAPDSHILAAPREKLIAHHGSNSVDFQVTLVNVEGWQAETSNPEWIAINQSGLNTLSLSISENPFPETRVGTVELSDISNPGIKDSVFIYQYSALNHYIMLEPREQQARRYSSDTLLFKVLAVNVSDIGFEVDDPDEMIDLENSEIVNDTLVVFINHNDTPATREARIYVYDTDRPDDVRDTVTVYQNFPYIILRPASVSNIPDAGAIIKIKTFSNIAEYQVSKGNLYDWFAIGKDPDTLWSETLTLMGNDSLYIRVDSNDNAFLRRSSHLNFLFGEEIGSKFWFDQDRAPGEFFSVSGRVFSPNDNLYLAGVKVAIYDSTVITNDTGFYHYDQVPKHWTGAVTPLIDASLPTPYYFLPSRIEIIERLEESIILDDFAAYKIAPSVVLTPKIVSICYGDLLTPGHETYPTATFSDTYGSSTYSWTSEPFDSVLAINPDTLFPSFGPVVTTTYWLTMNNFFRTAVDSFTIVVNQLPESVDFEGLYTVCSNQAGVIYQVMTPRPGYFYSWTFEDESPGGMFANSNNPHFVTGNIAIVNWGMNSGTYRLTLDAFNEFGCIGSPVTKTIEISSAEAPPPTIVRRKENDNMLYSTDTLAHSYQWGWFLTNTSGTLDQEYIIPGKSEWYCRLPEGHVFNPSIYHYFVIAYYEEGACGSRSFFNAPVGFEELNVQTVSIYPNPGKGIFTVRFSKADYMQSGSIEVYNAMGQMIYSRNPGSARNNETIDLNEFGNVAAGMYLILVRTPANTFSTKLIVQ